MPADRHRPLYHFSPDQWMNDPIPFFAIGVGEVQSVASLYMKPSLVTVLLFALVILLLIVRSRRQSALIRL